MGFVESLHRMTADLISHAIARELAILRINRFWGTDLLGWYVLYIQNRPGSKGGIRVGLGKIVNINVTGVCVYVESVAGGCPPLSRVLLGSEHEITPLSTNKTTASKLYGQIAEKYLHGHFLRSPPDAALEAEFWTMIDKRQQFQNLDLAPVDLSDDAGVVAAICAVRNRPGVEDKEALVSWRHWSSAYNEWIAMSQIPLTVVNAYLKDNAGMRTVSAASFLPARDHFHPRVKNKNRCVQTAFNNLSRSGSPMLTDDAVNILCERIQAIHIQQGYSTAAAKFITQGHSTISMNVVERFLKNNNPNNSIHRHKDYATSEVLRARLSMLSASPRWHRLLLIGPPRLTKPTKSTKRHCPAGTIRLTSSISPMEVDSQGRTGKNRKNFLKKLKQKQKKKQASLVDVAEHGKTAMRHAVGVIIGNNQAFLFDDRRKTMCPLDLKNGLDLSISFHGGKILNAYEIVFAQLQGAPSTLLSSASSS
jgi:hypothetical protein